MVSDVEHLFMHLLANCVSSFGGMSVQLLLTILIGFVFVIELHEFFMYFGYELLIYMLCKCVLSSP